MDPIARHPEDTATSTTLPRNPTPPVITEDLAILIPVFNDWVALQELLRQIDAVLCECGRVARVLIVDDGSTATPAVDFPGQVFKALQRVDVLALRRNLGHQRAIAIGLAYAERKLRCRLLLVMDGDGEDDPQDIPRLLLKCEQGGDRKTIFAERTRRSESLLFRVFYQLYRGLHWILTGYRVRVGNYSVIPRCVLKRLVVMAELWNHYAAAVYRSRTPYDSIPTHRAERFDDQSKMDFVGLVTHGLSAISVYGDIVGVRLLIATTALICLALIGLGCVVAVRLLTELAIPGWATYSFGLSLVVLLQAVMFAFVLCFVILRSRESSSFLPLRDYDYYVDRVETVFDTD
ncbi:MAG: glycosyltransferase [Phycisphaerae bacterium]|nr:glycosyltransferase [Phycisphaerae bacterium]